MLIELLFVAQCLRRLDVGGATSRDEAGQERDSCEQNRNADEGNGVGWADVDEEIAHEASDGESTEEAGCESECDQDCALFADHGEHLVAARSERHANADLRSAAADAVGHHAVDADDGEHEAEESESACDSGASFEEQESVGAVKQVRHRANSEDGHRWRNGMDLIECDARHRVSRRGGANLQRSSGHKILAEGNVEPSFEWSGNLVETGIFRDADDLIARFEFVAAGEGFSDGVLIGPVFLSHRGIDDRDWL